MSMQQDADSVATAALFRRCLFSLRLFPVPSCSFSRSLSRSFAGCLASSLNFNLPESSLSLHFLRCLLFLNCFASAPSLLLVFLVFFTTTRCALILVAITKRQPVLPFDAVYCCCCRRRQHWRCCPYPCCRHRRVNRSLLP